MIKENNKIMNMPNFTADATLDFAKSSYREKVTVMGLESISPAEQFGNFRCIAACNDRATAECQTIRAMEYAGRIPFGSSDSCFASIESHCNAQCR